MDKNKEQRQGDKRKNESRNGDQNNKLNWKAIVASVSLLIVAVVVISFAGGGGKAGLWTWFLIVPLWLIPIWLLRSIPRSRASAPVLRATDGRGTTDKPTTNQAPIISPWPRYIVLVVAVFCWGVVFSNHWWLQWDTKPFWVGAILLSVTWYWFHWSVQPGPTERPAGQIMKPVNWPAVFAAIMLIATVVGAYFLVRHLFEEREWGARIDPTASAQKFPLLNKLVGGKLLPTSRDPANGLSNDPVRPLAVRTFGDTTEVTIQAAGQWVATGLSLYPSEAVEVVAIDSLYDVNAPGWGTHTISVCGIAVGRQWYPEDLPVPGLQHSCLRATEPFGALMLRYGWEHKLPHYVGNDARYMPSSRERREVYLALNLEGDSPRVNSSGEIVVRLRAVPRHR